MTTDLLIALGKANIAAGAAIVAVIAVRKLVRRAFGARLAYAFWLAVPLAAAAALLPARTIVQTLAPVVFESTSAIPLSTGFVPIAEPVAATLDLGVIASWLWIAGAVVMAGWLMRKQAAFMADVRIGKAGPAVIGVLRPRIVTPSNFAEVFTDREQAVVLAHETTHIARQDVRANALAALAQCVCWFNPLIHVAVFLMRIDQELACDAQVVEHHPKARRTYGEAMLKAEMAGRPLPLGCCWPAGSDHPLTERIAMLKQDHPGRVRRTVGVVSILVLCAAAGVAAWAAQPPKVEFAPAPETPQPAPRTIPVEAPRPAPAPRTAPAAPLSRIALVEQPEPNPAPQPAPTSQQKLPIQAPFPGWNTPTSNDRWVPVTISGTITDVRWVNPSTQILVHGDDGKDWYLLSSTPNRILRSGGSREIIRKGVRLVVQAQQDLDIACALLCVAMAREEQITFNGAKLTPQSSPQDAPTATPQPTRYEPQQPPVLPPPPAQSQVTVEVTKDRPYYILGEVNRAGEYPFASGLTVLNAIAAAGDFTYRADKNKIMIISADGVEREVVLTSTTLVNPGDRIRIKERFF